MNSIPGPILRAIESLNLPAMPQILLRFLEEAGSERASMDTLAQIVMHDPALSARILTVANSAAFKRGTEMRSIKQSLQALGTRMVRTIASCLVVQSAFGRLPGAGARDLAGFWRHSLFVAELSRATAVELGASEGEGEEAYLAGLLHDVGQLVLLGGLGKAYGALLAHSGTEAELVGQERPVLGTDHGAVGAWVVDQWQLPSLMADAILFHHLEPEKVATTDRLTRILWSAHVASQPAVPPEAAQAGGIDTLLGIDKARFETLREQAAQRVESLADALGVSGALDGQCLPQWVPDAGQASEDEAQGTGVEAHMQATASAMAALQPLQQTLFGIESDVDLLLSVCESVRILFGVHRLAFFVAQPGRAALSGTGIGGQPGLLQRLDISLQPGSSLCADAAVSGRVVSSFDAEPQVPVAPADQQIARALGSDGLMYVPMMGPQGALGVMVCGVSTVQHARLSKRQAWLQSFASLVGASLESWRRARERDLQIEAEVSGRFRLQERKVAHEAANPLAIIRNYLTIVDLKLPDSKVLGEEIAVLREEIDRVSAIVRQLSNEEVVAAPPNGPLDLNSLVEGMRSLYGESLFGAANVDLEITLASEPALARADRDSVKQILLNLWKNAAESVPAGGHVLTSTATQVNQNGASFTELKVSDNGPGLPAHVQQSLYQPLGTQGPAGRSGMGLSIVRALVGRLSGHITCHTRAGQGTSFTVLLPASEGADR